MAKWYGEIGFAETVETSPGVWVEKITKRNYYGDLIRNSRRLQTASQLNDNINISNLADYYSALESKKHGDVITVLVRRNKKDVSLKVTLGE